MCQMSIVLQDQELQMENITRVIVGTDGIRVEALFEEPRAFPGMRISEIDCINSRIVIVPLVEAGDNPSG